MKKISMVLIALVVMTTSAFAVDFSIGITGLGWGPTFVRRTSDNAKEFNNKLDGYESSGFKRDISYNMGFSPAIAVVGQVDIVPYFGIELGVGYGIKSCGFSFESTDDAGEEVRYGTKITWHQLSIPLLLKGQYEIADMVNLYVGVGPKFNFNLKGTDEEYTDGKKDKKPDRMSDADWKELTTIDKKRYNVFDMDLSFAIGAEYKIANAHYIGLRVGYDMNLLGTMKEDKSTMDQTTGEYVENYEGREKTYIDDLAISLTYRYKFGQ